MKKKNLLLTNILILAFCVMNQFANAQIVYTDVNPDVTVASNNQTYSIDLNHLDFSQPTKKFKSSWSKKAVYDFYNNPKVKYKKIMRREAAR